MPIKRGHAALSESPITHNSSTNQDCAYAAELDRGFRWLRFMGETEAEFRRYFNAANLMRVRLLLLAGVLVVLGFALQNLMLQPQPLAAVAFGIDAGLVAPSLLLLLALTCSQWGKANTTTVGILALALIGVTTLAIHAVATVHGLALPRESLVLLTLVAYLVGGLRFWHSLAFGTLLLMTFVANELIWAPTGQIGETLGRYGVFFVSANIIGILGGYALEYSRRREFLLGRIVRNQAHRDGLTNLHNRRYLNEHLLPLWRQAQREGERLVVAVFDVDGFKAYNDTYGHLAGDDCLRTVAATIAGRARRPLDIAARYGGDEFAIVWYAVNSAEVVRDLVDRINRDVAALCLPYGVSPKSNFVSVSGGAATTVPGPGQEVGELFAFADQALYEAKRQGRGRTVTIDLAAVSANDDSNVRPLPSLGWSGTGASMPAV